METVVETHKVVSGFRAGKLPDNRKHRVARTPKEEFCRGCGRRKQEQMRFAIPTGHGDWHIFSMADVVAFYALDKYTAVKLTDGTELLFAIEHGTLQDLERSYPTTLMRVHRKYLINVENVSGFGIELDEVSGERRWFVHVQDGLRYPVSRRSVAAVRDYLKRLSPAHQKRPVRSEAATNCCDEPDQKRND